MAKREANFDLYIHGLLKETGINSTAQGSSVLEINNALKTASKKQTGGIGYPEYTAIVSGYVLSRIVLGEEPPEDVEFSVILKKAKELHEYLRNYGSLGEDEKPLVVSAILLALREQKAADRGLS